MGENTRFPFGRMRCDESCAMRSCDPLGRVHASDIRGGAPDEALFDGSHRRGRQRAGFSPKQKRDWASRACDGDVVHASICDDSSPGGVCEPLRGHCELVCGIFRGFGSLCDKGLA